MNGTQPTCLASVFGKSVSHAVAHVRCTSSVCVMGPVGAIEPPTPFQSSHPPLANAGKHNSPTCFSVILQLGTISEINSGKSLPAWAQPAHCLPPCCGSPGGDLKGQLTAELLGGWMFHLQCFLLKQNS